MTWPLTPVWSIICLSSWSFHLNCWPHVWQLYSSLSLWTLLWSIIFCFCAKPFPQVSQTQGFSPVCTLLCSSNWLLLTNLDKIENNHYSVNKYFFIPSFTEITNPRFLVCWMWLSLVCGYTWLHWEPLPTYITNVRPLSSVQPRENVNVYSYVSNFCHLQVK